MKTKFGISLVTVLIFTACSKTIVPTEPMIEKSIILNDNQLAGKAIYEAKCGKCHKLYDVKDFNVSQWNPILDKMQPKAKITDDQKAQVFDYIKTSLQ